MSEGIGLNTELCPISFTCLSSKKMEELQEAHLMSLEYLK
jgi:hypothetical protein